MRIIDTYLGVDKNNQQIPLPFDCDVWNFEFGIGKAMSWTLPNSYVFSQLPK